MFRLDESCFLQTSDVGLNNMRARINPAVCECLEAAGGLIVWGHFLAHSWPFSIVADHIHSFMITVEPSPLYKAQFHKI